MKKIALILFAMASFCLQAQEEPLDDFDSWDGDRDGVVTNEEFTTVWDEQGHFGDWDINGDGFLNENEWNRSTADYRERIHEEEINEGPDFNQWDLDRDGRVNENEFREGNFNTWDTDRDRSITPSEYHNYSNTMGSDRRY